MGRRVCQVTLFIHAKIRMFVNGKRGNLNPMLANLIKYG
jgi:hypothetical protein